MDILAKTDFKHGKVAFQAGYTYSVPPEFGGYFVGVGWAVAAPAPAPGEEAPKPLAVAADQLDPHARPLPAAVPPGDNVTVQPDNARHATKTR